MSEYAPWCDCLKRVRSEPVSDVVEADPEEGFGVIAVAFSCRSLFSKLVSSGSTGPGDGQGRKRHEQAELARISKARVLYVEAAGLGIAEQAFDRPAFAVCAKCGMRLDVGDHDQPVILERLGSDGQKRGVARGGVISAAETGSKDPASPSLAQSDPQGEVMPLLGGDAEVVSDPDGKGDIVFTQEFHPVGAYEFTVGQKKADSLRRKICEIALHQGDAHCCVGAAAPLDHGPDQGHPEPTGDERKHEKIYLGLADLPVRAVE